MKQKSKQNEILTLPSNLSLGKSLPCDVAIEQAILGAMMLERHACPIVMSVIKQPEVFFLEKHQIIFSSISDLFKDGKTVDILTVTNDVRAKGANEISGGAFYISELTGYVSSSLNTESHCRILIELWIKRVIISISAINQQNAYDLRVDAFDILDKSSRQIMKITEQLSTKKASTGKEVFEQTVQGIRKAMLTPGKSGLICGIGELDDVTGGDHPTDLIIIAARPGMGKTAYLMFRCCYAALTMNRPVMIFSLEMSAEQLMLRMISTDSGVSAFKLRTGHTSDNDLSKVESLRTKLGTEKLIIDDTPGISITELRAKAISAKIKYPDLAMIGVDYIQLMTGEGGNREQEIASVSRGLKKLAKELNIPIRALSQLSRSVETRGGSKRPQLSDLRESGAIEQDADVVEFLYRPEYYKIMEYEDGNSTVGHIDAIIAKNRHGKLVDVTFGFNGSTMNFYSLEEKKKEFSVYPDKFTQSGSIDDFEKNENPFK